jgi:hypothetical protein
VVTLPSLAPLPPVVEQAPPPQPVPQQSGPPLIPETEAPVIEGMRLDENGLLVPILAPAYRWVETDYGSYPVPKYDEMSQFDQDQHRNTFSLRVQLMNSTWRRYNVNLAPVTAEEELSLIHIRYHQACRYVAARSGANYYKIMLILAWAATEVLGWKMGLKTLGYTTCQLAMYDIYEVHLIEMGEVSGFGQDWPPWLKLIIISVVHLVVFVALAFMLGDSAGLVGTPLMKLLSGFIVGNVAPVDTNNDLGVPMPNDPNLNIGGFNLANMNPGNFGDMIGGAISMFTGGMAGTTAQQSAPPPPPPQQTAAGGTGRAARRANREAAAMSQPTQ